MLYITVLCGARMGALSLRKSDNLGASSGCTWDGVVFDPDHHSTSNHLNSNSE